MGGGAVIDAAAKLSEQEEEGVLKAVVAIAPWNGIPLASRPSDVAGEIKAPTLLFCSETDQITPCSGPWMSGNPALGSSWMSETLLANAFYTTDNTWGGGVQAIFDDTNNKDDDDTTTTYLLQFPNGGHFSLAGIGDDKLRKLGQEIAKGSGLGEWWNSFFIDYNIGVGEDKSNPLGAETAKSVGDSVRSLTIAFLGDTMLVSAEGEKNFTSALLVEGDGEEEGGAGAIEVGLSSASSSETALSASCFSASSFSTLSFSKSSLLLTMGIFRSFEAGGESSVFS
jgi:hypothetical protein